MTRDRALKATMVVVGLLFCAAIYPIAGDLWSRSSADYGDDMMLSLYFTLGVFLLLAVRNPAAHRSLIAFTAWSSFAHAGVMSALGFEHPTERSDFWIGSAVLAVIGLVLLFLAPAKAREEHQAAAQPQAG